MPDVTGMSQEQARDQLEAAGFQVGNVTSENSPDQPADRVLRTEPAKGQAVDAGSEITLVVSTGQVDLPNLVGQAQADARPP